MTDMHRSLAASSATNIQQLRTNASGKQA